MAYAGEDALALALVAAGHGVALVPASSVRAPVDGVRFVTAVDAGLRRTVTAVVRRSAAADPGVLRLLDALGQAARRVAAAVPGVTAVSPAAPATPEPYGALPGPLDPGGRREPAEPFRRPDPLSDPLPGAAAGPLADALGRPEPRDGYRNGAGDPTGPRRDPWADRMPADPYGGRSRRPAPRARPATAATSPRRAACPPTRTAVPPSWPAGPATAATSPRRAACPPTRTAVPPSWPAGPATAATCGPTAARPGDAPGDGHGRLGGEGLDRPAAYRNGAGDAGRNGSPGPLPPPGLPADRRRLRPAPEPPGRTPTTPPDLNVPYPTSPDLGVRSLSSAELPGRRPEPLRGAGAGAGSFEPRGGGLPRRGRDELRDLPPDALPPAPPGSADDVRLSIFEDLQSEWFTRRDELRRRASWQTAADDGWRAAARLAEPTTAGTTTAGLPKRRPQALYVPGTANGDAGARTARRPGRRRRCAAGCPATGTASAAVGTPSRRARTRADHPRGCAAPDERRRSGQPGHPAGQRRVADEGDHVEQRVRDDQRHHPAGPQEEPAEQQRPSPRCRRTRRSPGRGGTTRAAARLASTAQRRVPAELPQPGEQVADDHDLFQRRVHRRGQHQHRHPPPHVGQRRRHDRRRDAELVAPPGRAAGRARRPRRPAARRGRGRRRGGGRPRRSPGPGPRPGPAGAAPAAPGPPRSAIPASWKARSSHGWSGAYEVFSVAWDCDSGTGASSRRSQRERRRRRAEAPTETARTSRTSVRSSRRRAGVPATCGCGEPARRPASHRPGRRASPVQ